MLESYDRNSVILESYDRNSVILESYDRILIFMISIADPIVRLQDDTKKYVSENIKNYRL
jgi:hypothetical protein